MLFCNHMFCCKFSQNSQLVLVFQKTGPRFESGAVQSSSYYKNELWKEYKIMTSRDKRRKFKKADRFLSLMLCLWLVLMPGCEIIGGDIVFIYTIYFAFLSVISGYVSFLYSKLPKSEKEKPNWSTYASFNIHPYITSILLVFLTLIGFREMWIRFYI